MHNETYKLNYLVILNLWLGRGKYYTMMCHHFKVLNILIKKYYDYIIYQNLRDVVKFFLVIKMRIKKAGNEHREFMEVHKNY